MHKVIHEWSKDARPREKMMKYGAEALSNAELLAILIGSGTPEEDAVSLMQRILDEQRNDLDLFCRLTLEELVEYKGIGPAKAISLLSAFELARRRASQQRDRKLVCNNSKVFYELMREQMRDLTTEECHIIALDSKLHFLGSKCISKGGYTATLVDQRAALKYVLSKNGVALAMAHNHPSGSCTPSREDDQLTQLMQNACKVMGIRFIDHLIITSNDYYSYSEEGKI